jgi:filamin
MEATLTSPSGQTEYCDIRGLGDNLCSLKFTPLEEGVNTISLKFKGIHFAGSPFQYTVGSIPSGGSHKVEFGGPGVEQGEVQSKNEFNIYYREAGAGSLGISIEGPSKAKMDVIDKGNGYVTVGYVVDKEGEYGVHVKFNDEHVPESPAIVRVLPLSVDAKKVEIIGLRDRGLDVERPAIFSVQMNGAQGTLRAYVDTPSGTQEDVFITELDEDKNSLRFLPKENGVYYVHIKLNEAHIPGSPLPMLVGKLGADPALVFANGAGLEKGESGKPSKFTVVTTNAGSGTLAVSVDGPSKVALVCTEVTEGYEFNYTPMSPGVYMIMVKYSNITIAGAPFKATVGGSGKKGEINETSSIFVETVEKKPGVSNVKRFSGDAKRVVASGNGLKKGFHGRPSTFTLDFKDAGQGLLTMGMLPPSGNPVADLSFKKARATVYNVSYTAQEKGDHALTIRWGPDDIPGSPFTIPVS